ncbi:MAG: MGMT family protein [Anaerolineae bacterium]|nr:MGMT family protein [Anaerolineae bacterium]
MAKRRKTAREKLEGDQGLPRVVDDPRGQGKMLIPKPLDVDALMRKVQRGKLATVTQIRERLARDFNADFTCPLTTGIFIRIAAEVAAEENLNEGKKRINPYWRVIKADGSLNEKFPGGTEAQAARLIEEGHTILPGKGKKPPRVKEFEISLQKL